MHIAKFYIKMDDIKKHFPDDIKEKYKDGSVIVADSKIDNRGIELDCILTEEKLNTNIYDQTMYLLSL